MDNIKARRKEMFDFYNGFDNPLVNICEEVYCPNFIPTLKKMGVPVFHYMLYSLCKTILESKNFLYRYNGKEIYSIKRLIPSYTVTDKDGILNFCTFEFVPDFNNFLFLSKQQKKKAIESSQLNMDDANHQDYVFITCIPWIKFTSISHPIGKYKNNSIPAIALGKITPKGEQLSFPLSIQAHHGLVDGIHIAQFISLYKDNLISSLSLI